MLGGRFIYSIQRRFYHPMCIDNKVRGEEGVLSVRDAGEGQAGPENAEDIAVHLPLLDSDVDLAPLVCLPYTLVFEGLADI